MEAIKNEAAPQSSKSARMNLQRKVTAALKSEVDKVVREVRAQERAAEPRPVRIVKPQASADMRIVRTPGANMVWVDWPADRDRELAFGEGYWRSRVQDLSVGDIMMVRDEGMRWVDRWYVTGYDLGIGRVDIVVLEHIEINATLDTTSRSDGYKLENRGVRGWATISPTGAVVAEGLPGEREAAYRADADKPKQIK